jgi:hypothetical protein
VNQLFAFFFFPALLRMYTPPRVRAEPSSNSAVRLSPNNCHPKNMAATGTRKLEPAMVVASSSLIRKSQITSASANAATDENKRIPTYDGSS